MLYPTKDIVHRHPGGPIVKPADMPKACCAVYNAGAAKTPGGEYVLASRFESIDKTQYVWVLRSRDGIDFTPDPEPLRFAGDPEIMDEFGEYSTSNGAGMNAWWDPRITPLEGSFYMTLSLHGRSGVRIGIAKTDDFKTAQPVSFPFPLHNYGAALFPEKINGLYWMLHRPSPVFGAVKPCIWIASSPDLIHWGNCRVVAQPHKFWEETKIGVNTAPLRTERGWFILTHGVFPQTSGKNYSVGAMLLDLERPWKVVARTAAPLFYPETPYEISGPVPNVVYPNGLIVEPDGTARIYYGAADYAQCLATAKFSDLIEACFQR